MSHTRTVCPHDVVITQCRCIKPHKATKVVRPCPFGDGAGQKHEGYAVVHPEQPTLSVARSPDCATGFHDRCAWQSGVASRRRCGCPCHATAGPHEPPQAPEGEPMTPGPVSQVPPSSPGAAEGFGPRAVKACVFRTCDWTIAEPDSLLGYPAMDEEIRIHLRTHRVEIELMAEAIR